MLAQPVDDNLCDDHSSSTSLSNSFLRPCSSLITKGREKVKQLSLYSLSFRHVRHFQISLPCEPPPSGIDSSQKAAGFENCYCYSSNGWLLIVRRGLSMSLYSPFYSPPNNYIQLPGPESLGLSETFVKRFVLSSSPSVNSYTVMIAYDEGKVAIWRPGDLAWTPVETFKPFQCATLLTLLDVTFYQGHYYAISDRGIIFRFSAPKKKGQDCGKSSSDADDASKKMYWQGMASLFPGGGRKFLWRAYFAVQSPSKGNKGKLLVVVREPLNPFQHLIRAENDHLTAGFRVLEIVFPEFVTPCGDRAVLNDVKSLGNMSLFVGRNQSLLVDMLHKEATPVLDDDDSSQASCSYGCKPNCVYFTDDRLYQCSIAKCASGKCHGFDNIADVGVYNMADGSIQHHFPGGDAFTHGFPLMWVEPCRLSACKILENNGTAN